MLILFYPQKRREPAAYPSLLHSMSESEEHYIIQMSIEVEATAVFLQNTLCLIMDSSLGRLFSVSMPRIYFRMLMRYIDIEKPRKKAVHRRQALVSYRRQVFMRIFKARTDFWVFATRRICARDCVCPVG